MRELASGGMSRQDVVRAIIDTFQPARPIAAVQFLAKVTFEQVAHKREVMACEHIRMLIVLFGAGALDPRMFLSISYRTKFLML